MHAKMHMHAQIEVKQIRSRFWGRVCEREREREREKEAKQHKVVKRGIMQMNSRQTG